MVCLSGCQPSSTSSSVPHTATATPPQPATPLPAPTPTATSIPVLWMRPVCLFSSPPLTMITARRRPRVRAVCSRLEHQVMALTEHHRDVVPFGPLGAMAGDGVRQLELWPVDGASIEVRVG